jgi:ABC-type transport system involved in multi-copper enzyme maturation permease subunit
MFNYLKYILSVPRKFILTWAIAPALYFLLLPLAFANDSVESLLIDTQKEAFRGMSENETLMNFVGISDWDNVFTLEGMVTTYFLSLFGIILVAVATIVLLNKMGAKAEEDGTFEFVASLPMTRSTVYLTQSIVAVLFGLFITFTWTNIMYIPMATMELSQTLDYVPLMKSTLMAGLAGVSYGVLGFALGAYTGKSSYAWGFGAGLMAIEWISNSLSGTNDLFLWIDNNIASFGAYGEPYQEGLIGADLTLVLGKIVIFLIIGFIGFRKRSLNLR